MDGTHPNGQGLLRLCARHGIFIIYIGTSRLICSCYRTFPFVLGAMSDEINFPKKQQSVAERKNFKLLFSAGIILAVEVSTLYFRRMRMI